MALIAGVASCKIGLESNISPADYPLIRVVPSRLTPGKPYGNRTIETLIYFGAQTAKSEGWKRCTATCSTWNPPSSRPCRAWAGATGDDHGRGSPGRLQTHDDSLRADPIDGRFGAVSGHATCASALT